MDNLGFECSDLLDTDFWLSLGLMSWRNGRPYGVFILCGHIFGIKWEDAKIDFRHMDNLWLKLFYCDDHEIYFRENCPECD